MTFTETDRRQLVQLRLPTWAGDLISKDSTHRLQSCGLVLVSKNGMYSLSDSGMIALKALLDADDEARELAGMKAR